MSTPSWRDRVREAHSEHREEVAAQSAKIQNLQDMVRSRDATIATHLRTIEALVGARNQALADRESFLSEARAAVKDRDREVSRAKNLEDALDSAQRRCKSLEESCRRMVAEHDQGGDELVDTVKAQLHNISHVEVLVSGVPSLRNKVVAIHTALNKALDSIILGRSRK